MAGSISRTGPDIKGRELEDCGAVEDVRVMLAVATGFSRWCRDRLIKFPPFSSAPPTAGRMKKEEEGNFGQPPTTD